MKISLSQISLFCANRSLWYRKYVQRIPDDILTLSMLEGRAIHMAMEVLGELVGKNSGKEGMEIVEIMEDSKEMARTAMLTMIKDQWGDVEKPATTMEKSQDKMSDIFDRTIDTIGYPLNSMEQEVRMSVGVDLNGIQVELLGVIDSIENNHKEEPILIDYKLCKTFVKKVEDDPSFTIQAWIYYILYLNAYGVEPKEMQFILIKNVITEKSFKVERLTYEYSPNMHMLPVIYRLIQLAAQEMLILMNRDETQILPNIRDMVSGKQSWDAFATSVLSKTQQHESTSTS